jgi:hypothetical protein
VGCLNFCEKMQRGHPKEALGKFEYRILCLHQHIFSMVHFIACTYNLSNDFCLKLRLPYSYDFCKRLLLFQNIVAGSGRISQLFVQVFKVKINFECKNAPTRKFTTCVF